MTTVHTGHKTIIRPRRRPPKTATNARSSREVFGEQAVKQLSIPVFIDLYNHCMNGVDVAHQLRSYYMTQRTHLKNWKPLWHFLDSAVTNAYKIAHYQPQRPNSEPRSHVSHKLFRAKLARQLFARSMTKGRVENANKAIFSQIM